MMRGRRGELLLLLGSLVSLLLLGAIAEIAARAFSRVDLLGNSKALFVAHAYGASHGNAPNAEAIAFGDVVHTDAYGFRVPDAGPSDDDGTERRAILILGDSVGFGPAVEEEQTLAGLLRKRFPERRIYNSSVIGYTTRDYRNVVEAFVPLHPEVEAVVLLYCLNDVSALSAQNIERHLEEQPAPAKNLTETLRSVRLLSDANDFLRSRSKLYLLLRHRLLRTQQRDWQGVLQLYTDERTPELEQSARDIAAISTTLEARGIPLVVVLAPFEYQLRAPQDPETRIPQQRLRDLLTREGVAFIDARPYFDPAHASADYFLAYDPMHFSAQGHRVIAEVIGRALDEVRPAATRPARS